MQKAICLSSREPLSAVLSALVKLFAGHRAGIWGRLCSRRGFAAALGPDTGAGSEHREHRLWLCCSPALGAAVLPGQGCAMHGEFLVRGKQLGFHLSRFMDKFTENCSSWLGLCHSSWTPVPTVGIGRGQLCPVQPAGCSGWCSSGLVQNELVRLVSDSFAV